MNTHVEMLTESTIENGKSILAATLVVQGEGEKPHRVVLRYWRGEYVTYIETLKAVHDLLVDQNGDPQTLYEHASYEEGHYHGQDFDRAMRDFHERAAAFLSRLTRKA